MEQIPGITQIGVWSQIKLEIVKRYAESYSTVLSKSSLMHDYIDAFAGAGIHLDRNTKDLVPGSPLNALNVKPPFSQHYLIDLDGKKTDFLRDLTSGYKNVHIFQGDCNDILLEKVFPNVKYEDYRRALCLLDPYGLHLDWNVIETAAKMRSIEIFLNFPIMDMNRNHLRRKVELVDERNNARMTRFWGNESWRDAAYQESRQTSLFGDVGLNKATNDDVAESFRGRLINVAGFKFVPKPLEVKNSLGATIYYLFFASHNETGDKIATHVLNKFRH